MTNGYSTPESSLYWYVTHQQTTEADVWLFWNERLYAGFKKEQTYEQIDRLNLTYIGYGDRESIRKGFKR